MASIRLERIGKRFPGVQALREISLEIATGEFFTLLGPSGCGKTTLLRILAGFYLQDGGDLYFDERLMNGVPPYSRNAGMVFQNYAVFPHMTVFENVAFGLRNRRVGASEIARRVARVLEMARLEGYERRTPDQLSGGQQQRVGLARAMVIEPEVLLMDEPLSNLDAKLRVEMREEIRDIQRQLGITTIYVTHDQEEALVISDRIAVMNQGEIHQVGTAWDIYQRPADSFAASFVGRMNFIEASVEGSGSGRRLRVPGQTVTLSRIPGIDRLDEGTRRVTLAVRPEDIEIDRAQSQPAADGFVCLVEKSTFTGSLIEYTLRYDAERTIIVERHRPELEGVIANRERVIARIAPQRVHLFDAECGALIAHGGTR